MATANSAPIEGGPLPGGPALAPLTEPGTRLAEFFEANGRTVYGLCRVLLRDRTEAEDAAQQTFLSAYEALLTGAEPREPAAWLAAIARNECRRRLLRSGRQRPLVLDEDLERPGDVEQDAGDRAEIEALCAALAELPTEQRQAVLLREFYGLSYAEIATALATTVPAVESLLHRTRRRLQTTLRPQRAAAAAIGVPIALHASLARAIPGFSASGGGGTGVATSVLAKTLAAPLGAKVAAAVAVAAIGASLVAPHTVARGPAAIPQRAAAAEAVADAPAVHDERTLSSPTRGAASRRKASKAGEVEASAHGQHRRQGGSSAKAASAGADDLATGDGEGTPPPAPQGEDGDAQGEADAPAADDEGADGDSSGDGAPGETISADDAAAGSDVDDNATLAGSEDGQ